MVTRARPGGQRRTSVRATVRINDEAFRRAAERLRGAAAHVHNHRVTLGLHEDRAEAAKVDYAGRETAQRLVQVAAVHEFGAGPVPARSFLREWFDDSREALIEQMREAMRGEYQEYRTGLERSPAMVAFGTDILGALVARMRAGLDPELAASTVRRRRAAGLAEGPPLIATTQLVRALAAKVDGFQVVGEGA